MSAVVRRNDTKSTNEAEYHLMLSAYSSAGNAQGATRDRRLPKPRSIAAPFTQSPKHAQQPQQPLPRPYGSPCAARPPAHPSRACAPCPSHCAGPYGTGFSSTRVILAAMDTYSSSCTRMAMPLCLLLWHVVAVCARACRTEVRVRAHVFLCCVDHNSGVLWTQRLILGCFHVYINYTFAWCM